MYRQLPSRAALPGINDGNAAAVNVQCQGGLSRRGCEMFFGDISDRCPCYGPWNRVFYVSVVTRNSTPPLPWPCDGSAPITSLTGPAEPRRAWCCGSARYQRHFRWPRKHGDSNIALGKMRLTPFAYKKVPERGAECSWCAVAKAITGLLAFIAGVERGNDCRSPPPLPWVASPPPEVPVLELPNEGCAGSQHHHPEAAEIEEIGGCEEENNNIDSDSSSCRLVLSSVSDYFAAMFTSDVREAKQEEVKMEGVDPDALWALVQYAYSGRLELREETIESLLSASCLLQLPAVVQACCSFLAKQLHPSNCLGIRSFADAQGCVDLHGLAHDYTMEHFLEVMRNQEFLLLPPSEMEKLLSSDDMNVPDEETVLGALLSWVQHGDGQRQQHLPDLLAHIRLPLLAPQFLVDMESNPLLQESVECQRLMMEAMRYHLLPERRPLLQSPRTRPRKATVGAMFAVGGMDATKGATSIEQYCLRKDTWRQVAVMSGRRLQFGVTVLEDRLYVVGGRDGLKTLNTVECYNPRSKSWSVMPAMSTNRHGLDWVSDISPHPLRDLGQIETTPPMSAHRYRSGERSRPNVHMWIQTRYRLGERPHLHTLPETKACMVDEEWVGSVHSAGTDSLSPSCSDVRFIRQRSVQMLSARQWSFVASMATPRSTVGVAVLNNKLYAVGGRDGSSCLKSVECFDPHTNKWSTCGQMANRRGGVGVATWNGFLYAIGGHDAPASSLASRLSDCVERYDPKTDTWTAVAPMSISRDAVGVCLLGDRLYAVGGYDGQMYLNTVETYDPQTNEWTQCLILGHFSYFFSFWSSFTYIFCVRFFRFVSLIAFSLSTLWC
ncbi:hypothetical protein JZ751_006101 [Albula glossodonta]|uniref:BTB domain-containing protein n=1 Tax=Albula glossodonta TaxID=121402 RepID=A0A8T2P3W0_9TELE|nr:hypothetical protein JZ751_006101 [Albula glossodonta]